MRESARIFLVLMLVLVALGFSATGSVAQVAPPLVETPNFRDQTLPAVTEPASLDRTRLRFLTSVDYPPFNFLDARGRLAGFNVELARAICDELGILDVCQIEARPFAELLPALRDGEGDAVIAGVAVTPETRESLSFTDPYFRYPARFVGREGALDRVAIEGGLAGRRIGVVEGTAHEAMLRAFFPGAASQPFADRQAMLDAVKAGGVEAGFGDAVGLSFWLASENAESCCVFLGGPYLSDVFLGEGLAIALRGEDAELAEAFDAAIVRIVADRRFSELLLRYFPISAF